MEKQVYTKLQKEKVMTDEYKTLSTLLAAVTKNTVRPTEKEMEKIKVDKKILTSPKMEGDSKIGMILFCGVAKMLKISDEAVMDFICIEGQPELDNKVEEFYKMIMNDQEFCVKMKLVTNYMRLQN